MRLYFLILSVLVSLEHSYANRATEDYIQKGYFDPNSLFKIIALKTTDNYEISPFNIPIAHEAIRIKVFSFCETLNVANCIQFVFHCMVPPFDTPNEFYFLQIMTNASNNEMKSSDIKYFNYNPNFYCERNVSRFNDFQIVFEDNYHFVFYGSENGDEGLMVIKLVSENSTDTEIPKSVEDKYKIQHYRLSNDLEIDEDFCKSSIKEFIEDCQIERNENFEEFGYFPILTWIGVIFLVTLMTLLWFLQRHEYFLSF